jgi:glutaredoxin 3
LVSNLPRERVLLPVTLYTKSGCTFCAAARADLEGRGVPYTEIDVTRNPERIPELLKLTGGRRVVPVIVDGAQIRVAPSGGDAF